MALPRQKKKNKSSLPRVRQKPKSKLPNIKSNPIVAANWNANETLSQNYRRLGLISRLKAATGGIEKSRSTNPTTIRTNEANPPTLSIPTSTAKTLQTSEVKVIRDTKTGAILRILRNEEEATREAKKRKRNPLGDPLNELSDSDSGSDIHADDDEGRNMHSHHHNTASTDTAWGIIPQLEASARQVKKSAPRKQSQREREWVQALVEKWGDDWRGMVRDRKLNPMQQSEGDIKRRVGAWKRANRVEG